MKKHLNDILIFLITLSPILYAFFVWDMLPDRYPIHYGISGEADSWSTKTVGVLLLPLIGLFPTILLSLLPYIDPKYKDNPSQQNIINGIRWFIVLFLVLIQFLTIRMAMGDNIKLERVIFPAVFGLFIVLGNLMNSIKQNYFIGVRTPWTLESEYVWRKTHQLTSKIWVYGGLILLPISLINPIIGLISVITFIILGAGYPVYYSYKLFKEEKGNMKE